MIERLFFDGINAETGRTAIRRQHHLIADTPAYEACAALTFMQLAVARTEVALDAAIPD